MAGAAALRDAASDDWRSRTVLPEQRASQVKAMAWPTRNPISTPAKVARDARKKEAASRFTRHSDAKIVTTHPFRGRAGLAPAAPTSALAHARAVRPLAVFHRVSQSCERSWPKASGVRRVFAVEQLLRCGTDFSWRFRFDGRSIWRATLFQTRTRTAPKWKGCEIGHFAHWPLQMYFREGSFRPARCDGFADKRQP
jgi:hypothetical protein